MRRGATHVDIINKLYNFFGELGLEPQIIPEKSFNALRGGIKSYAFSEGRNVDAGILVSKLDIRKEKGVRTLYKIEYALRGTLKGIEKGRVVALTTTKLSGILKKKVQGLRWIIPKNRYDYNIRYLKPPTAGEVWIGSPYTRIADCLNLNSDFNEEIIDFINKKGAPEMRLLVNSDMWSESIRINSTLWLPADEIKNIYTEPQYLDIVKKIFSQIIKVRREFGGLTF